MLATWRRRGLDLPQQLQSVLGGRDITSQKGHFYRQNSNHAIQLPAHVSVSPEWCDRSSANTDDDLEPG